MCTQPRAQSVLQLVRVQEGSGGSEARFTRMGRLADGRVATAPPSGGWNPHAEDMRTETEIKAVSRHLTPTLESEKGWLGDIRPFIVARVRLSTTPMRLR